METISEYNEDAQDRKKSEVLRINEENKDDSVDTLHRKIDNIYNDIDRELREKTKKIRMSQNKQIGKIININFPKKVKEMLRNMKIELTQLEGMMMMMMNDMDLQERFKRDKEEYEKAAKDTRELREREEKDRSSISVVQI